jgi:heme exporter protein A
MLSSASVYDTRHNCLLNIHNLDIQRGYMPVCRDLQLQLDSGDMLRVSGANGSGKSSLLAVCAGLLSPQAGSILFNAYNIREHPQDYAFQREFLGHRLAIKHSLTVAEHLQYLLQNSGSYDLIKQLNLFALLDTRAAILSQGNKQKLALARILLSKAPIWILDEPFAALDHAAVALVYDLLIAHCERGGIVIYSSHLDVAAQRSLELHLPYNIPTTCNVWEL